MLAVYVEGILGMLEVQVRLDPERRPIGLDRRRRD
jgi:hypothetical protein